jgi:hypothetical protein
MSEDHIAVAINGVLYVKFEDAKKLREGWDKADAEIEKLRAAVQDLAKHIWRGDWDKLKPETRELLGEKQ